MIAVPRRAVTSASSGSYRRPLMSLTIVAPAASAASAVDAL
jgi:hypothetical protein